MRQKRNCQKYEKEDIGSIMEQNKNGVMNALKDGSQDEENINKNINNMKLTEHFNLQEFIKQPTAK